MTFAEFEEMVKSHDLTYNYSDDGSVWRRGMASEKAIRDAAKQFLIEDVKRVWNAKVDAYLIEEARAPFYWRD